MKDIMLATHGIFGNVLVTFAKEKHKYLVRVPFSILNDGNLDWLHDTSMTFLTYKHACEHFLDVVKRLKKSKLKNAVKIVVC